MRLVRCCELDYKWYKLGHFFTLLGKLTTLIRPVVVPSALISMENRLKMNFDLVRWCELDFQCYKLQNWPLSQTFRKVNHPNSSCICCYSPNINGKEPKNAIWPSALLGVGLSMLQTANWPLFQTCVSISLVFVKLIDWKLPKLENIPWIYPVFTLKLQGY